MKKRTMYIIVQRNKDKKFNIEGVHIDKKTALENLATRDTALLIEANVICTIGE